MNLTADHLEMVFRLIAALIAGALIGYERSYHSRPAGMRTHALVCTASSLLMLVTVFQAQWVRGDADLLRLDPTRMAQGIMTGIGFLGAGVIVKEGLSVRGLTTSASIWMTSAIGILAGIGFYFPLLISVVLTIGLLSAFRWFEARMPSQNYYHFEVRFEQSADITETTLRRLVETFDFSIANFSYRMDSNKQLHRHAMVLRTSNKTSASSLAAKLQETPAVVDYRISPFGE